MYVGLLYNQDNTYHKNPLNRAELMIQLLNGLNIMEGRKYLPLYVENKLGETIQQSYIRSLGEWKEKGPEFIGAIGGFE